MRTLELLAPAKNLECGIAAIDHGADAVYIGAPRFGARAAAGNSLDDIRQLCRYAHQYQAKVHVTVNTIIYDSELNDTLDMIHDLQEAGVDALLLQDMGVLYALQGKGPSAVDFTWTRELHSSTQCDTRSAEKVKWLQTLGFNRAVLARELSVKEISDIHQAVPDMDLEVFVHGALCVSYSGVCYASERCFGRSANRGECAQFCRMKFNLLDSDNKEIEHQRHLLSLKDMCQIDNLEALADAGACSFKIEGRLKDAGYVKNVVSAYSQRLDEICRKHPQKYARPSFGRPRYEFEANLKKTFNRGFTNYFLKGRQPDIASFDTPKAIGEFVGKVKEIRGNSFNVASIASFTNGDGLCFINDEHELEGFRVNRAQGNRLFPLKMPMNLRPGMGLYRNNDQAFEKILAGKTAERKIPVRITFGLNDEGFSAEAQYVSEQGIGWGSDDSNYLGKGIVAFEHNPAQKPQHDNIVRQLSKLGGTIYECREVEIKNQADNYFIPSSVLTELRRNLMEDIEKNADISSEAKAVSNHLSNAEGDNRVKVWQREYGKYGYLYNIANKSAHEFYKLHGMNHTENAFELGKTSIQGTKTDDCLIMQCRHCIRYSLGYCVKRGGKKPTWKEPLYLELGDGRRFRLEFACNVCQMNIYSD
ncbi:U32 family peptidase [Prevotella copri]|uniref:U32 family peptidase n=1 Tax=Segatella copri TaxID=165179 RepID=A0A6G1TX77_9BACT|nr:U32 family peptidase [Segatella copri]MQN79495.1 U32 family peptidase [Segatella copri]